MRYLPPANEVWGKVIFSVMCVKNSVHRTGRRSASVHAGIPPPLPEQTPHRREQAPPWEQIPPEQTPLEQAPPQSRHPPQCMLGDTVNKRAVSYWNAILFLDKSCYCQYERKVMQIRWLSIKGCSGFIL